MLYHYLKTENEKLLSKIQEIKYQLDFYPEGSLLCSKNRKYEKCFHYYNKQLHYIKNDNRDLTLQLAEKKYLSSLLNDLTFKQKILNTYLDQLIKYEDTASKLLAPSSRYRKYITESLQSFSTPIHNHENPQSSMFLSSNFSVDIHTKINEWNNTPYEHNTNYPEHLIHTTYSGYKVRSKTEAIIDTSLFLNKIPFRYECALPLLDTTYYPDFTIMHPKTGQLFYWEHFGKIDDPVYFQNSISKLNVFANNGIIPSHNLIITSETSKIPFSIEIAERVIHEYFL